MQYIDEAFKRKVVAEYERGGVSKEALRHKHGIRAKSAVLNWLRQYGTRDYGSTVAVAVTEKPPLAVQDHSALAQQLAQAQLYIAYLEASIEILAKEPPPKKKSAGRQSNS